YSQFRKVIWTANDELITEDRVSYENNGLDYIPFDCKGKPVYFEVDEKAKTLLSENHSQKGSADQKDRLLVPLEKGEHSFRVQGVSQLSPSLLGGFLRVPVAEHELTAGRSSVRVGVPAGIYPIWLFGGERVDDLVSVRDVFFIGLTLLCVLIFLKGTGKRLVGFICLVGTYIMFPMLYSLLSLGIVAIFLGYLINRSLKGWRQISLCLRRPSGVRTFSRTPT
ncbi:MAG: hypothetical protein GY757_54005, partial [bacterium]|nr:hypothetical protein [bacterium]